MDVKRLLAEKGFRFNKQFGQNFLTDDVLLRKIADDANIDGKTVLEIGAGAGTLTRVLAERADKVVAFEIDRNLEKILDITLADFKNVQVVIGDVMRYTMQQIESLCGGAYSVVANIPYYITTPLIMNFAENSQNATSLTLTIQKEVAERLVAKPSTKQYGAITVGVDAVANAEITRVLPRNLFYPQPNVDSAVVKIVFSRGKYDIKNAVLFRKTVKAAFAMRRKTLANNLIVGFGFSREKAENVIAACGLNVNCRGEELSTVQFVDLCNELGKFEN
ncbi:MAG: 16S rRNA (adenine(1518)-N(6)/adenine(1519)-N(6))-dimethyltransferase RsmA [Corallococcus sp.]|nr:16S rRNA (adenine(1518)-N(6)/adenine(1519)-N(6))-dimethyltransferase RsmA [Corallococcus sp.]MCM1359628.1 16S rRNA (adenine(1518)-N(6)/adenine(1519)-N(6))-dimethyltransferase RsmA [Corallococcus sp.]MCM1395220.1 16S rRNA (adenine(1518)-N(6)/adenine(1519)-N(6))-dimethyltransferase RsmA [Corallococcus sp.]